MKKLLTIAIFVVFATFNLNAKTTQKECSIKGDNFIYASGECIEFYEAEGERTDSINIIVHGTWKKGTNVLARYSPFADNIAMATDITTIAVALPGYSGSSTNKMKDLNHNSNTVYTKSYIKFMGNLIKKLKEKYKVKKINYMGHSAGATLGTNVVALNPDLITTLTAAGGRYDLSKQKNKTALISISQYLNNIKDTKILLIYGTADKISKPEVTTSFYKLAKNKGIDVKIVKVVDAPHLDLDMTDEAIEAVEEMLGN